MVNIADNAGHILSPLIVDAVNVNDTKLLPSAVTGMVALLGRLGIDVTGSYLTFDSGFDSAENKRVIKENRMIPVIKPNPRNEKNRHKTGGRNGWHTRRHLIYAQRFTIERCYAWEDTYRKLVIRYETLQETFLGWRYLASALVNFRECFGRKEGNVR